MNIEAIRANARERARAGLEATWRDYLGWLTATFPRIAANLAPPDPEGTRLLDELHRELRVELPEQLVALYRLTGGEPWRPHDPDRGSGALFGHSLLPPSEVLARVRRDRELFTDADAWEPDPDAPTVSLMPDKVRATTRHRLWIPFTSAGGGTDAFAVDLAPEAAGTTGQIVLMAREQNHRFVVAASIAELVALLHELGAAGEFQVVEGGPAGDESDEFLPQHAVRFDVAGDACLSDQMLRWS